MPARGLNGEAYRGHVFWDEMYAFPFLNVRLPEVTRGLLMYRYRRIGEARAAAREAGFRGAMFPWQSGSEGIEETQRVHLNPLSGRWEPDLSHNQRHVNAAIFFNIWNYFQATHDYAFLESYGAEMMLEIARFWASIAHFNPARERYEIHGVMGPDEFHEKYPGARQGGLANNAYTNVMVAWLCDIAARLPSLLSASSAEGLRARLGIADDELALWQDMSRRMFVPFDEDGIISQFEGWGDLEELDWDAYRAKYGNIQRLDRILRAEGDDPDRYKIAKQADTVMLFFLFSDEELREIFERLGYDYRPDTAARNVAYYDQRTSHGSTLSFVTYAGCSPPSTRRARGTGFSSRSAAMSTTSRAARRRKGSTWVSWPGHSTSCSGTTRAPRSVTVSCTSTPGSRAGSAACHSRCSSGRPRSWSRSAASWLTLDVQPEGASHEIRAGIPGDIRRAVPGRPGRVRAQPESSQLAARPGCTIGISVPASANWHSTDRPVRRRRPCPPVSLASPRRPRSLRTSRRPARAGPGRSPGHGRSTSAYPPASRAARSAGMSPRSSPAYAEHRYRACAASSAETADPLSTLTGGRSSSTSFPGSSRRPDSARRFAP